MKLANNSDSKVGIVKLTLWQTSSISRSITILIMANLLFYCTDTLHVKAGVVSIILMLSKIVDGFTDAVAGFIVDKTKTKLGTGRPYEVFIIGLWIATWLMFSVPASLSTTAKYVWIFCMYVLANAICTTFLNANATPYVVRAFKEKQIVKVTSYGSIYTIVAAILFNMFFPRMMNAVSGSTAGWSRLVLSFAIPMAAIGILRMIFIPEKYEVDTSASVNPEGIKFKDAVAVLKSNPYVFVLALMTLVFNFVSNMGVGTYYFTYIVGNLSLMGTLAVITIVTIPVPFLFPKLIQKFSVTKLMMTGFFISAAGYLVNFFAGSSLPLLMLGSLLTGVGTLPASMLLALAILQCADYNEFKGNHRMEGTMSSVSSLAGKVGAAVGAGALGIVLQAVGYTGDANTSAASITAIHLLYSIVPMVLYILTGLTLMRFGKLDKMMPEIKEANEAKRTAAEAEV